MEDVLLGEAGAEDPAREGRAVVGAERYLARIAPEGVSFTHQGELDS
jgi:hypothetical protein